MKNNKTLAVAILAGTLATSALGSTIFITSRDGGSADLYQYGLNGVQLATLPGNGLINGQGLTLGVNGNLFVSSENGVVLQYNPTSGAFISTFASGLGSGGPLILGPDGNLYLGSGGVVKKLNGTTGALIGSIGATTGLNSVSGLAFDGAGNLYAGDGVTGLINKYDSAGLLVSNFVSGNAALAHGAGPLLFNGTTLLVSATFGSSGQNWGSKILAFGSDGSALPDFASDSHLNGPAGMAFGPDGNLYVVNYVGGNVVRFSNIGAYIDTFIANNPPTGRGIVFALDAPVNGVPEPATAALLGGGLLALGLRLKRR